jgi:DeoR family transcriptional regulator of aga operon
MVKPGEAIILDSGTTTAQIARFLPDDADIVVLTNDADILGQLVHKKNIEIVLLGGRLRRKNMAFYGGQTEAALDSLQVDRLFLGVDGIDLQRGITTHFEAEAALNRKMAHVAREVVAVTDSSKFGRTCLHRIMGLEEVNVLITDGGAPEDSLDQASKLGCDIRIA